MLLCSQEKKPQTILTCSLMVASAAAFCPLLQLEAALQRAFHQGLETLLNAAQQRWLLHKHYNFTILTDHKHTTTKCWPAPPRAAASSFPPLQLCGDPLSASAPPAASSVPPLCVHTAAELCAPSPWLAVPGPLRETECLFALCLFMHHTYHDFSSF